MKSRFFVMSIALASLLLASCSYPDPDSPAFEFHYPLATGNQWSYYVTSTRQSDNGTVTDKGTETVQVIGTSFYNTDSTGIEVRVTTLDGDTATSWYSWQPNGLYLVASRHTSPEFTAPKHEAGATLFPATLGLLLAADAPLDSIVIPEQSRHVLPPALFPGIYWTYVYDGDIYIRKKVTGTEKIRVQGRSYNTFRIEWNVDTNMDGVSEFEITDYVGEEGLVLRTLSGNPIHYYEGYDPLAAWQQIDMRIELVSAHLY